MLNTWTRSSSAAAQPRPWNACILDCRQPINTVLDRAAAEWQTVPPVAHCELIIELAGGKCGRRLTAPSHPVRLTA